ncbi:MAG TPA: acyl carrier protein [Polyangiaceae bacterium]|nr:acyl carrier protein [Polyangiaceae bacterium]
MTDEELKAEVCAALERIAPEADLAKVPGTADLREELDLDSMDFLNFVVQLHERLQVDIPESEYRRFYTLDDCVRELRARLASA